MSKFLAICLESIGCTVVLAGIIVEFVTRAAAGHLIISIGSLLIAAGGILFAKMVRKL